MVKNTSSIITNLENVKLVIGNGFDLYCGLKTTYKDYYDTKNNELTSIRNIYDYIESRYLEISLLEDVYFINNINIRLDDAITIWDIIFYINSRPKENKNWCDIEKEMTIFISGNDNKKITIDKLLSFYFDKNPKFLSKEMVLLYSFLKIKEKRNNLLFNNEDDIYIFLYSELKFFERKFGYYIYSLNDKPINVEILDIENNYKKAIKKITFDCQLMQIDSFNYNNLVSGELNDILYNINGDINNPIFGIDSNDIDSSDRNKDMFTKTTRRIEQSIFNSKLFDNKLFENMIIFGHSLNKADYSYFFAQFDQLDIINNRESKIVFIFYIYDSNNAKFLINDFIYRTKTLMIEYFKQKGMFNPIRMFESMRELNRIIYNTIDALDLQTIKIMI